MFRLLLLIMVIAIGYDAVVHQGVYTRSAWISVVGMADAAIDNARQLGQNTREEPRP